MSKKIPMNVRVSTFESELEFAIQDKTTGETLFDQVVKATGIRETWYFGLSFTDSRNQPAWLIKSKKIVKQDLKKESVKKFQFKFKYFPENVADEVIQDNTMRMLYKQIREEILNESIYCPAEKAVLLASFAVQAKFSDFDESIHTPGYLANEKLLPQSVINQHKLSIEEWEEKVSSFHKQHRGQSREEAILDYLKIAQDLEMFGITYFPIMNKRGTEMLLGVDPLGINIYDKSDKLTPKITFPWSEIKKISHNKDKFKVRLVDKSSLPFEGKTKDPKAAEKIYDLSSGNHDMFIRRRKPDTLEVQQMKSLKAEEKKTRQREREALRREIAAREKEESKRKEMEERLRKMQEEMEKRGSELSDAMATIERLQRQLEETQLSRQELEKQQSELKEMLDKLEADRNMELSERLKLEEEIAAKQNEILEVKADVEAREEEAMRLQREIEDAKRQLEETTENMQRAAEMAALSAAAAAAAARKEEEARAQQNGAPSSSSSSSASSECGESVPKIVVDDVDDEYRETDSKTEQLLKELRMDLEEKKDMELETDADRQYRENLSQGRDKFKTLREIRRGNTKRRIDSFENM